MTTNTCAACATHIAEIQRLDGELAKAQAEIRECDDEYAIANRHISKLADIVVRSHRKLGYLLRDYPDDKETRGIVRDIDALIGKEQP